MVGRTACAALVLLSPLVGCLLTTSLDDLESGAGGMSGSGASTSSMTKSRSPARTSIGRQPALEGVASALFGSSVSVGGVAPFDVALDGGNFYWTDPGAGRVMKVMNGEETVVADGSGSPRNIAVDATSVYWTDNEIGMVLKAPK